MRPEEYRLSDGSLQHGRSRFRSPPQRCFVERDLYTTFFGTQLIDEVERRLFGAIDSDGAPAIKAFTGEDVRAWHRHFRTLFRFIDIQKLRTPKGLDWLKTNYPRLSQNQLMMEMQGIQAMHCTIWSEGVREIVSAVDAGVKFIISDHPVTVYNHSMPPDHHACRYPLDPSITLKGSQTIYPLNRDHCLILTNLEYAQDEDAIPTEKRIFARSYRRSMVRTDAFIRQRRLTSEEVRKINRVIKARARRYVAAGREDWLDPELGDKAPWSELRSVLRPPQYTSWGIGGELYAKFDDGSVHYQDAFGRTEKESGFLRKNIVEKELRSVDACGCGSGKQFGICCRPIAANLRPSWTERGVRERNLMLYRGINNVLGLDKGKDWLDVRRDLTDDQIRDVHTLFLALWPIETDILGLLPKPDGRHRSVYTGLLHPHSIMEFAIGSSLYFGELIVEHPFVHAAHLRPDMNPIENPRAYHQDFIQTVFLFLMLMPFVETGHVNLVPNPTVFDLHLHRQMLRMAERRSGNLNVPIEAEPRIKQLIEQDMHRSLMCVPSDELRDLMRRASPELGNRGIEDAINGVRSLRELDPLASVQDGLLDTGRGGQVNLFRMAPNFEMALYIAQATGASIVTDSPLRWREIHLAVSRQGGGYPLGLPGFTAALSAQSVGFAKTIDKLLTAASTGALDDYNKILRDAFNYLVKSDKGGTKPNWESSLAARLSRLHETSHKHARKNPHSFSMGTIHGLFPAGGIQDNAVNRLLLMSNSEYHLHSVPMAFFIKPDVI